eukprot:1793789-Pyramimonas_sp.AAC.1
MSHHRVVDARVALASVGGARLPDPTQPSASRAAGCTRRAPGVQLVGAAEKWRAVKGRLYLSTPRPALLAGISSMISSMSLLSSGP